MERRALKIARQLLRNAIVSLIAIFSGVAILFSYSLLTEEQGGISDFIYVLVLGGGAAIVPLFLFITLTNYFCQQFFRQKGEYLKLGWSMFIALLCMFLIIAVRTWVYWHSNPVTFKLEGKRYFFEYTLYVVAVPAAVIINYLLYERGKGLKNTELGNR